MECLALIALGFTNKEIAEILFVTLSTIKAHTGSIIKRLNAKDRTNAVYIAMKFGILTNRLEEEIIKKYKLENNLYTNNPF